MRSNLHANEVSVRAHVRERGFTLIEIAVVLAIGALLLGFGLSVLSAQLTNARIKSTQHNADAIKSALITFMAANNRLPCPAIENLADTNAAYGVEAANPGTCTGTTDLTGASRGVVPWKTLGLSDSTALDGWNRRFTYAVTTSQTSLPTSNAQVQISSAPILAMNTVPGMTGNMTVHDATPVGTGLPPPATQNQINACSTTPGDNSCNNFAVVMLISHGANGDGAFLPGTGARMSLPTGANELENTDTDVAFTKMGFIENSSAAGGVFDDIVLWIPPADLVSPLVMSRAVKTPQGEVAEKVERVERALLAYIVRDTVDPDGVGARTVNRRVPSADTDATLDGTGNGSSASGTVPYTDIGLGQQDAFDPWGRPFRYTPGGLYVIANSATGGIFGSSFDTNAYLITSFGPDGALGGGDDYSITRTVPEMIGTLVAAGLTVDP